MCATVSTMCTANCTLSLSMQIKQRQSYNVLNGSYYTTIE